MLERFANVNIVSSSWKAELSNYSQESGFFP